jgi:hypothetical protein
MTSKQSELERRRKVVIVGAGPVGCLSALSFAKQGWEVEVFEGRPGKRVFCCLFRKRTCGSCSFRLVGRHAGARGQGEPLLAINKPCHFVAWNRCAVCCRPCHRGPFYAECDTYARAHDT